MGISAFGALVALTLALVAQSPGFMKRFGLAGSRLELRIRAFTGYALALLLLAMGFFLAGVPLGGQETVQATVVPEATEQAELGATAALPEATAQLEDSNASPSVTTAPQTPASGAFSGPPAPTASPTDRPTITPAPVETGQLTQTVTSPTASATALAVSATASPPATASATPTPSATPTQTSTPSATPTAISGETALVDSEGSTVWIRRSPGGQNVILVNDGQRLVLLAGRANQAGILWREVSTVDGVIGWIQAALLAPEP